MEKVPVDSRHCAGHYLHWDELSLLPQNEIALLLRSDDLVVALPDAEKLFPEVFHEEVVDVLGHGEILEDAGSDSNEGIACLLLPHGRWESSASVEGNVLEIILVVANDLVVVSVCGIVRELLLQSLACAAQLRVGPLLPADEKDLEWYDVAL